MVLSYIGGTFREMVLVNVIPLLKLYFKFAIDCCLYYVKLSQDLVEIGRPISLSIDIPSGTWRIMASPIYDTRNTVNETVSRHTTVDPALKFGDVIPAANIVALEAFDPVKHAGNPLQLLVLLAGTDGIGLFTKIDIGVPTFATFFGGPGAQVVVELAKITNSCCLNDASSPKAATLDIRAARRVHDRGRIVETASLLPVIVVAVFGRVGPGLVAFLGVIPETRE